MSSREDYAKLTSSDGYEFFVEREVIPKGLSLNMPYQMRVVQKIIEYLHYKHVHIGVDLTKLQEFVLDEDIALEVLKASLELKI